MFWEKDQNTQMLKRAFSFLIGQYKTVRCCCGIDSFLHWGNEQSFFLRLSVWNPLLSHLTVSLLPSRRKLLFFVKVCTVLYCSVWKMRRRRRKKKKKRKKKFCLTFVSVDIRLQPGGKKLLNTKKIYPTRAVLPGYIYHTDIICIPKEQRKTSQTIQRYCIQFKTNEQWIALQTHHTVSITIEPKSAAKWKSVMPILWNSTAEWKAQYTSYIILTIAYTFEIMTSSFFPPNDTTQAP